MIRIEVDREWPKTLRKRKGDNPNFTPSYEATLADAKAWVKSLAEAGAFETYKLKRVTFYDNDVFQAELKAASFKPGAPPFRPTFVEQHTEITW